jgi:predicted ATP-dependent Lon-type protease
VTLLDFIDKNQEFTIFVILVVGFFINRIYKIVYGEESYEYEDHVEIKEALIELRREIQENLEKLEELEPNDEQGKMVLRGKLKTVQRCISIVLANS